MAELSPDGRRSGGFGTADAPNYLSQAMTSRSPRYQVRARRRSAAAPETPNQHVPALFFKHTHTHTHTPPLPLRPPARYTALHTKKMINTCLAPPAIHLFGRADLKLATNKQPRGPALSSPPFKLRASASGMKSRHYLWSVYSLHGTRVATNTAFTQSTTPGIVARHSARKIPSLTVVCLPSPLSPPRPSSAGQAVRQHHDNVAGRRQRGGADVLAACLRRGQRQRLALHGPRTLGNRQGPGPSCAHGRFTLWLSARLSLC